MASQQSGTLVTTQPQQQTEQCRKCGKKNHPTSCCHQKVTCRKCKGKDHSTKFCSTSNQEELKCTFCGKTKHSLENCKARKKAEKKIQKELEAKRTSMVTSICCVNYVHQGHHHCPRPGFHSLISKYQ